MNPVEFLKYVAVPSDDTDCWLWLGRTLPSGHATYRQPAGRIAYELFIGPIPPGLELDHVCHSRDATCTAGVNCPHRRCVNPLHLEPVTRLENASRSRVATKTHCVNGHLLDEENTYLRPHGYRTGRRGCRACKREQLKAYRVRKKAEAS